MPTQILYSGVPSSPTFVTVTETGGIVQTIPAPAAGRGILVQLGRLAGLNLNSVAATTIFTTPGSGFTRCVVFEVVIDNYSMSATTASVSFGASGTPTDWATTATNGSAAAGKMDPIYGASSSSTYGTGVAFVANVTTPQGVAATCDVIVLGWYE